MALETGTYIQDLDPNNPLAGDKKNQGDDHIRLVKALLKATFPNADRPVRFIEVLAKTGNYTVLAIDDNKIIVCDTTVTFTLTLPTPTIDGWLVRVMKTTTDANPVYVAPPSGTINGFAKIRVNVPFVEHMFLWTGSVFIRQNVEPPAGEIMLSAATVVPVGHLVPAAQSLVRLDNPELFAAFGATYGAVDGTHFSLPNLLDRFAVFAGGAYALGATGGEATHILSIAELAAHTHPITDVAHDTANAGAGFGGTSVFNANIAAGGTAIPIGNAAIDAAPANTGLTGTDSSGNGTAHENRPPYFGLYPIVRLC